MFRRTYVARPQGAANIGSAKTYLEDGLLSDDDIQLLRTFRAPLVGLTLSHLWRGAGSAIFLEFGPLTANTRTRRDGTLMNPRGEFGLMIQWSWRIESATSILCGNWSEEQLWEPTFDMLRNSAVVDVSLFGRLPEIIIAFSDDRFVSSFMTAEGDPGWALFDRRGNSVKWLDVRNGRLTTEAAPPT
jgi:hypothetical protein